MSLIFLFVPEQLSYFHRFLLLMIVKREEPCPAAICYRYLSKRINYLDYKTAIDADLPIGSGEIESAHRSVIQKRLKLSGSWWTIDNARYMINLRVLRANNQWDYHWKASQKFSEFSHS